MTEFSLLIYEIIIWFFLLYSAAVFLIYTWLGLYAMGAVFRYKYYNTFTDYMMTLSSMNLRDMNDRKPILEYQWARAKADFKSYGSAARIGQDLANLPGVSMLSALMRGTERK